MVVENTKENCDVQQVVATMAIENMYLSPDFIEEEKEKDSSFLIRPNFRYSFSMKVGPYPKLYHPRQRQDHIRNPAPYRI